MDDWREVSVFPKMRLPWITLGNQVFGGWWWGLWINPAPTMPTSVRQTCRIAQTSDNSHWYLYRRVTPSRLGAHPRRAHAGLVTPHCPRKASAVLGGVHPKTGS